jgi:predicted transposase/invertase (TIGR01784 family)
MHEMDTIPDKFSTPEFKRLFILAKIGNFTAKEYEQYLQSMKDMSDYYNIIDTAAEEAEKRGKMCEKMRTARKLLAMGMPLEQVSEATEMPIDEISALEEQ